MVKIPKSVQEDIAKRSLEANKKEVDKPFDKKFNEIKEQMIEEFLSNPVTAEILSGPTSSNTSGTLGGEANLFSFIGFSSGDKPIEPIVQILRSATYKETKDGYKITIPSAEDIFAVTPMPWATGRSWAKGIETGISGLGYLLNKKTTKSRSGAAIQSDKKVRSGGFKNTLYISSLIKKYKKRFKKILW